MLRTLDEVIIDDLQKHPEMREAYLKSAMEESNETHDKRVLIMALRNIAEANGISKTARKAGLSRETFYKALSTRGNPRLETLFAILEAVGCKLSITFNHEHA